MKKKKIKESTAHKLYSSHFFAQIRPGKCRMNCLLSSKRHEAMKRACKPPPNKSISEWVRVREKNENIALIQFICLFAYSTSCVLLPLPSVPAVQPRRERYICKLTSIWDGLEWYLRLKYENRKHHVESTLLMELSVLADNPSIHARRSIQNWLFISKRKEKTTRIFKVHIGPSNLFFSALNSLLWSPL